MTKSTFSSRRSKWRSSSQGKLRQHIATSKQRKPIEPSESRRNVASSTRLVVDDNEPLQNIKKRRLFNHSPNAGSFGSKHQYSDDDDSSSGGVIVVDDDDDDPLHNLKKFRLSNSSTKAASISNKQPSTGKKLSRSVGINYSSDEELTAVDSEQREDDASSVSSAAGWQWTDEEQVVFRPVVRINVHEAGAAQRVTEARHNGVPVCLVGHRGWPQFAKRWLQPLHQEDTSKKRSDGWIDLSKPHKVNVAKMIKDIGNERVPLLRPDYDEENPCKEIISVSSFLKKYWRDDHDDNGTAARGKRSSSQPKGYMHQWQFPLSAPAKLCGKVQPLPNDIFGEDLLRYWLDQADCQGDSPFQYLFMGDAGTMSKLHRDSGGLTISIAPIVGEKECVMVHRSDGASCMYHLAAELDNIDLQQYPLMAYARIWKTVVRPGEILIMPQGTYHQCRNVTPCLSYSRFHLDTVNLRPFLESWVNGDAKEIDHDEVIWNASCELRERLDQYVIRVRKCTKSELASLSAKPMPHDIVQAVNTLRSLRHICRAITQRLESLSSHNADASDLKAWRAMVKDIDLTLHEFRYRYNNRLKVPLLPQDDSHSPNESANEATEQRSGMGATRPSLRSSCRSLGKQSAVIPSNQESLRTVGFVPNMEEALSRLTNLAPEERDCTISDSIQLFKGAQIDVRYHGKRVKGKIVNSMDNMQAAYISYEGYSPSYDEYQAFECLRMPMTGDFSSEMHKSYVREGSVVLNRWGANGEEYRAVVLHTRCGTFYLVELALGQQQIQRWIARDMVVRLRTAGSTMPLMSASAFDEGSSQQQASKVIDLFYAPLSESKVGKSLSRAVSQHHPRNFDPPSKVRDLEVKEIYRPTQHPKNYDPPSKVRDLEVKEIYPQSQRHPSNYDPPSKVRDLEVKEIYRQSDF